MTDATLYPRLIQARIQEALADTPVVLLAGPRQSGKTTLVRQLATALGLHYLTLDDATTLLSARQDATGLIRGLDRVVIDEVQRAPQLLLAIKKSVDEDRRPGRFLLTGSANLMTLPTVADSLAGRMETLSLLPLSQSEIHGADANWIDAAFAGRLLTVTVPILANALAGAVLQGGFPEAISRATPRRRTAWARQYIGALIARDVPDVAEIDKLDQLPLFLRCLAHVSGQMCNYTQLGGQVGLDSKTAARYVGVFEQMYMLQRVDVWARNQLNRAVKTPKLQFIDSGLLAALIDLHATPVLQDRTQFGHVLETFVHSELLKHTTTSEGSYNLLYYRDFDKFEVDVVIENAAGRLVGVEVKAAASVTERDLRGLKKLASVAGPLFQMGVVLYDGTDTLPLGDGLWAAPLSTLWGT
jgi:predicted AAA+ superfamily ATPase